jgi:hypothetical protein
LPHADDYCPVTVESGVRKRAAAKPPKFDKMTLLLFRAFVLKFCEENLIPLSPDSDCEFETWIEKTPYPLWRKNELREVRASYVNIEEEVEKDVCSTLSNGKAISALTKFYKKFYHCKSFVKDETYIELKHPRIISSRSDHFKVYVGPIFRLIEERVFKLKEFIKHTPVEDRPQEIINDLYSEGSDYKISDYTSFEASFVKELMENCEFVLYDYMTQFLPIHEEFMRVIREALLGENSMIFKMFTVYLSDLRQSGEMNTSLGNGWTNSMAIEFICRELCGCSKVIKKIEGDDSVFRTVGGREPTPADFEKLGLNVKLQTVSNLTHASFCGLVFDIQDKMVITEPFKALSNFGWTSKQYAVAGNKKLLLLLRAKSYSMIYTYPGAPILAALGRMGLRVTQSVTKSFNRKLSSPDQRSPLVNYWDRIFILRNKIKTQKYEPIVVGLRTRLLAEELYGVKVEHQIAIEKYLDGIMDLQELDHPYLQLYCPDAWFNYSARYVMKVNIKGNQVRSPTIDSNQLALHVNEFTPATKKSS